MPSLHDAIREARGVFTDQSRRRQQHQQVLEARLNQLQKQIGALPPPAPLVESVDAEQAASLEQQEAELVTWLTRLEPATTKADQAVPALLERHPALRAVVRQQLLARLAAEVRIDPAEWPAMAAELWQGLPGSAPADLHGPWLEEVPGALRPLLEARWLQLRLQRWCVLAYGPRLETYYQEHADELTQVVFSMIRLDNKGTALELYLRLLDEGAQFNELARRFATGDERATLGVIGPRRLGSLHPRLRTALNRLALREVHEPLQVDEWFVLLRLESRLPASLDLSLRQQLLQEMLDQDLTAVLAGQRPPHAPQLLTIGPQRLFPHP